MRRALGLSLMLLILLGGAAYAQYSGTIRGISLRLRAQHAALAVVGNRRKIVVAKYGF
jgi:hypothetical protein